MSTAETPTRLVLIRHGESRVTVDRVIGGKRTCAGLSELGRRQAEALRRRLARSQEVVPDLVVASDFPRAIETAELLAPAWGGPGIEIDPGFGEHDPGPDIDGLTFDEYIERFGIPDWTADPRAEVFPGGETVDAFHRRVVGTLTATLERTVGLTTVVSCHGGVIDAVFRHLLGMRAVGGFELHTVNTSITEFVAATTDRWRLVRYNDAAHLAGLPEATPRGDRAAATDRIVAAGETGDATSE
jgi:probable phosphoglycerate mutase